MIESKPTGSYKKIKNYIERIESMINENDKNVNMIEHIYTRLGGANFLTSDDSYKKNKLKKLSKSLQMVNPGVIIPIVNKNTERNNDQVIPLIEPKDV